MNYVNGSGNLQILIKYCPFCPEWLKFMIVQKTYELFELGFK